MSGEENATPNASPDEATTITRLRQALKQGRPESVVAALQRLSPQRRAERFLQFRLPEQKTLLMAAPAELAAAMLSDCDSGSLGPILTRLDIGSIAPALRLIPPDNMADIVLRLPEQTQSAILACLEQTAYDEVRQLMRYDPESAGGLMTTRYLSVPDVVTVGKALELLRSAKLVESASYVYVVDAGGRLVGTLTLRQLLLANARQQVHALVTRDIQRLQAATPLDAIVDLFHQHHFIALPVTDEKERLIGIVTFDDIMAVMRERQEDIVRGVTGVDPREAVKATLTAARGRLPWITVTLLGGLACTGVGGLFQHTLAEWVVVGIFIPIVLALGESIGTQTTSVVLSAIVHRTLAPGQFASFMLKETLIGALIGVFAGGVVAVASLGWHGDARLGVILGAAIATSMLWAATLAVLIPHLMLRCRVDPTLASGPLVLALADVSTLGVYFGGVALFA